MTLPKNKKVQLGIIAVLALATVGLLFLAFSDNINLIRLRAALTGKTLNEVQFQKQFTFRGMPVKFGFDLDDRSNILHVTGVVSSKKKDIDKKTLTLGIDLSGGQHFDLVYYPETSVTFVRTQENMPNQRWGGHPLEDMDQTIQIGTVITTIYEVVEGVNTNPQDITLSNIKDAPPTQVVIHKYLENAP